MEIVWSETAIETFFKVIDYLTEHWTEKQVVNFDISVEKLLQRLASHQHICPESKIFGYRKCVIDQYNSLVYYTSNNKIFLVTFLDNRSLHDY